MLVVRFGQSILPWLELPSPDCVLSAAQDSHLQLEKTCDLVDHVVAPVVDMTKKMQMTKSLLIQPNRILLVGNGMEMLDVREVYDQQTL